MTGAWPRTGMEVVVAAAVLKLEVNKVTCYVPA